MKQFILGVIVGLVIAGAVYIFIIPRDFGNLKVTVLIDGKPITDLEVDLNKNPGPPKYFVKTDINGTAFFARVPVGKYVIFFNKGTFPKELNYNEAPLTWIVIQKDQTAEQKINLFPASK